MVLEAASSEVSVDRGHAALAYRPDIDGLRAVAVVLVILYHAFPDALQSGFIGVDIFFVISGYLITLVISQEHDRGRFSLPRFYRRRIRRIFPALAVVLGTCLVLGFWLLLTDEFKTLGKHVAFGALFSQNIVLWRESGYFDVSSHLKPLLHLWSLAIEEQFYLTYPLLFVFIKSKRSMLWILVVVGLVLSFSWNAQTINLDPSRCFYLPNTRAWELLCGAVLAHLARTLTQKGDGPLWGSLIRRFVESKPFQARLPVLREVAAVLGLAMIVAALVIINQASLFPGYWALYPVMGTVLIIASGPTAWINARVLSLRGVVYIGLISYPLYLWHWLLISYTHIVQGGTPSPAFRLGAVLASLGLSSLTYHWLEKPLRHSKSPAILPALVVSMVAIACCGWLAYDGKFLPRSSRFGIETIAKAAGEWEWPGGLVAEVHPANGRQVFRMGGRGPQTLFYGDSNIQQYAPRIEKLLSANSVGDRGVIFYSQGGCPPIDGVFGTRHSNWQEFTASFKALADEPAVDTVVIGAQWFGYFTTPCGKYCYLIGSKPVSLNTPEGQDLAFEALEKTIRHLVANQKRVYLVLCIPIGKELDPKGMVQRNLIKGFTLNTAGISRSSLISKYGAIQARLRETARKNGAIAIDPFDFLCDSQRCWALDAVGEPIYKDASHLRPSFVRSQVTYLDQTLLSPPGH